MAFASFALNNIFVFSAPAEMAGLARLSAEIGDQ